MISYDHRRRDFDYHMYVIAPHYVIRATSNNNANKIK